jgi:large subunit ribosomal protein L23
MNIYSVIKKPHVTEKTSLGSDSTNTVSIVVDRDANKIEIKQAVETLFKVQVSDVRTVNVAGKMKRFGKTTAKRSNWKKAYVTLQEGQSIHVRGSQWQSKVINLHQQDADIRPARRLRKSQQPRQRNHYLFLRRKAVAETLSVD